MIKMYIENVKTAKGNWVDFPVDIEEMMENFEVENLGQLDVMDYEANFTLKNYKNIEDVNELAEILDDMDNREKQIAENLIEERIIVYWEDLVDAVHDIIDKSRKEKPWELMDEINKAKDKDKDNSIKLGDLLNLYSEKIDEIIITNRLHIDKDNMFGIKERPIYRGIIDGAYEYYDREVVSFVIKGLFSKKCFIRID